MIDRQINFRLGYLEGAMGSVAAMLSTFAEIAEQTNPHLAARMRDEADWFASAPQRAEKAALDHYSKIGQE